jgi:hypothetical protein
MSQISQEQECRWRVIRMNLLARSEFPNHRRMLREKVNHCWDILQKNKAGEKGPEGPPITRMS